MRLDRGCNSAAGPRKQAAGRPPGCGSAEYSYCVCVCTSRRGTLVSLLPRRSVLGIVGERTVPVLLSQGVLATVSRPDGSHVRHASCMMSGRRFGDCKADWHYSALFGQRRGAPVSPSAGEGCQSLKCEDRCRDGQRRVTTCGVSAGSARPVRVLLRLRCER